MGASQKQEQPIYSECSIVGLSIRHHVPPSYAAQESPQAFSGVCSFNNSSALYLFISMYISLGERGMMLDDREGLTSVLLPLKKQSFC